MTQPETQNEQTDDITPQGAARRAWQAANDTGATIRQARRAAEAAEAAATAYQAARATRATAELDDRLGIGSPAATDAARREEQTARETASATDAAAEETATDAQQTANALAATAYADAYGATGYPLGAPTPAPAATDDADADAEGDGVETPYTDEQIETAIIDALRDQPQDWDGINLEHLAPYHDTGILTRDRGLIVRSPDGAEWQITIRQSRRPR